MVKPVIFFMSEPFEDENDNEIYDDVELFDDWNMNDFYDDVYDFLDSCAYLNDNIYECLENYQSDDTLFFYQGYDEFRFINFASIAESNKFEAIQYLYDEINDRYVFFHGHPSLATDTGDNFINQSIWLWGEYVADVIYNYATTQYKYDIITFSEGLHNYYFYTELNLYDPIRTNLRDKNNNPVMGGFGSMASRTKFFKILLDN